MGVLTSRRMKNRRLYEKSKIICFLLRKQFVFLLCDVLVVTFVFWVGRTL